VVVVEIIVVVGMRAYPAMAGLISMRAGADAFDMAPTLVVRCSGCQQLPDETIAFAKTTNADCQIPVQTA
jgi:hypothetical protein